MGPGPYGSGRILRYDTHAHNNEKRTEELLDILEQTNKQTRKLEPVSEKNIH